MVCICWHLVYNECTNAAVKPQPFNRSTVQLPFISLEAQAGTLAMSKAMAKMLALPANLSLITSAALALRQLPSFMGVISAEYIGAQGKKTSTSKPGVLPRRSGESILFF
jgi:hypothetical protein